MSVELRPYAAVPNEDIARNEAHARSLGLQRVYFAPPHNEKIAIVGGGHSLRRSWDELRTYKHILAINGTRKTLLQLGADATFISVDPLPVIADFAKGSTRAIVATRCHPSVFEALKNAHVRVFDSPGDVPLFTATASTFIPLVFKMGFRQLTFFGCDSCFHGTSHIDRHEEGDVLRVRADGKDWYTTGDMFLIARELSEAIRANPGVITEKSGGLLRAMVRDTKAEPVEIGKLCLST